MNCYQASNRGSALITVLIIVMVLGFAVVGVVGVGSRSHTLTRHRMNTARAFYAAEAGMNMAMRELSLGLDEDGDGIIGSISDDSDDSNDPSIGGGRVSVSLSIASGQMMLVSTGRCDSSSRRIEASFSSE